MMHLRTRVDIDLESSLAFLEHARWPAGPVWQQGWFAPAIFASAKKTKKASGDRLAR